LPSQLRQKFGLNGQQPAAIESLEKQANRALKSFRSKHTELEKYTFMAQLRNNHTRLFYKLVNEHIEVCCCTFLFSLQDNNFCYAAGICPHHLYANCW
jgi:hypothetical protein